ncbi:MAG: hypothetical protein E7Z70_02115 [Thermoplasmata archaeon]|nr:hypothetical protein [Thermoplasmata archaeon]
MPGRGRPDHEAHSVTVQADNIDKPREFHRNGTHNGNRTIAEGNVSVKVSKRHPESKDDDFRPGNGVILKGGKDQAVTIEAKLIKMHGKSRNGQDSITASEDVRIFGKLKRFFRKDNGHQRGRFIDVGGFARR